MAKPFVGYGLVSGWNAGYGVGFRTIGITSIVRRQVYGRFLDDDGVTHTAERDLIHQFSEGTTQADALAAADRYKAVYARLTPAITEADRVLRDLQRRRSFEALDAAKTPVVVCPKCNYSGEPRTSCAFPGRDCQYPAGPRA